MGGGGGGVHAAGQASPNVPLVPARRGDRRGKWMGEGKWWVGSDWKESVLAGVDWVYGLVVESRQGGREHMTDAGRWKWPGGKMYGRGGLSGVGLRTWGRWWS